MVIKAGRFFPPTKICSGCGMVKDEMPPSDRTYYCDARGPMSKFLRTATWYTGGMGLDEKDSPADREAEPLTCGHCGGSTRHPEDGGDAMPCARSDHDRDCWLCATCQEADEPYLSGRIPDEAQARRIAEWAHQAAKAEGLMVPEGADPVEILYRHLFQKERANLMELNILLIRAGFRRARAERKGQTWAPDETFRQRVLQLVAETGADLRHLPEELLIPANEKPA